MSNGKFRVLCVLISILMSDGSQLKLDSSNKFQDMLVYINDDILEGDGSLLKNIKEHIDRASLSLWKATSNLKKGKAGVQFGTVHVRIPMTWMAVADAITWQQCNKADFYVTTRRDNNNSTEPYTKQLGKCGEPASFTKFSEDFFVYKNETDLTEAGKKIMNEFVKLRYGVFSEKPYSNVLTVFTGFNYINSTCGPNIKWTINKPQSVCSDYNKICRYKIERNQSHNYSVMFDTETPGSEFFCNDDDRPHNKWAKSLHNVKCNRRSISNIILQHADFSMFKATLPLQGVNFKIIKGQHRKIALVLDVSGSMASIIDNMRKACSAFINDVVEDSAIVGLATFSSVGTIKMGAHKMDVPNKQHLMNLINGLSADGGTNIPDGLAKGVEILGGHITNDAEVFGTIILLSDGGNNVESPYTYDYAINQIIKKGISVNTICYGNAADTKLNRLAKESGGQYLYADPNTPYLELMNKFRAKKFCEKATHHIKMFEDKITLQISGSIAESKLTYLDRYIGNNVQIAVTFTRDISKYTISLISPTRKIIKQSSSTIQSSGTTLTFFIPGAAEIGQYNIQTKSVNRLRYKRTTDSFSITFTVSATPEAKLSRIINPTGQLSRSDIEVLTDTSLITATIDLTTCSINEKEIVSVKLTITTPSQVKRDVNMTDDGLGDDSIDGDYIFTKILIAKELNEMGFYGFIANIQIFDNETKDIIQRSVELGSVRVKALSPSPIQDKVPPAKIEDLNIIIVSSEEKEINLEITTTGNDGMVGEINNYEVKITSPGGEIVIKKKVPLPPRVRATLNLTLSAENVTNPFEISLRGVDDADNYGEWSLSKTSNWHYKMIVQAIAQKFDAENEASKQGVPPHIIVAISVSSLITVFNY